ncbi:MULTISPECIES: 4-(cytidine 5'-diphospho)-2-C-methyl-D-erythritol kinase [unclassified Colwellia]|uniref:4-(cytidine 5'-diphospho)-2-C-methyl-D-erythritol kinase n=1 Tax=unclassified Colwellia TaxID=196834 RepID=UPI0015F3D818|nr:MULTISPECIES: 4-(cytidine 5'-diphospho)-2-C-methyl-D-erythritol kinase [unclassified Colwellia]MBA6348935.1 4-(cytidine 5'-diphospho)-2-C-methyl-D-erythritol kinase [Colwellia sp. BRX8-9]MBA6380591.1 4-(cytidine 5'-diphospho)-2-C-methyl-D-erythritol kinase [Colwellia sp. BRX10-7]MBA6387936.1 4-(cytidine 5'-diphospho)-2-C-methyl-D-erythritol kinase [Colwellia sp. BRX10-2]MBA6402349.1 4-(cytidine 5'-diphospho)-2-C-methyl-D-erythritol kinase [Colwellia sp. BRX10-5]MBA6407014.1 4-(cytidine 5'-d
MTKTNQQFYSFPAPAKLNLFLHIIGQRNDGYHQLETIFQFLDHSDTIEIRKTQGNSIELLTPIDGVLHEDNLIVKAARLLQNYLLKNPTTFNNVYLGAQIKITKILPMGGGLGGGSSNAATILLALNTLWQANLSTTELAKLGLSLGADVPIFIHGFSAFAEGVGEELTAVYPQESWFLVSKPDVSISTASIFTDADLTRNTAKVNLNDDISKLDIDLCHNDCQTLVIKKYPEVAKLLAWLVEYAPSRMTGTGACIFSRFDTEQEACRIQSLLPNGIISFVAKGVNTSPLRNAINNLVTLQVENAEY